MNHLRTVLISLLLLYSITSAGQSNNELDTTRRFAFTIDFYEASLLYDRHGFWGEIGTWKINELFGRDSKYDYTVSSSPGFSLGFHGLQLGTEFGKREDEWVFAPKLGYSMNFMMLKTGVNFNYLTNFQTGNWGLSPHVGVYLWLCTYLELYLTYEHNFRLSNNPAPWGNYGNRIKLTWMPVHYNRRYQQWRIKF